MYPPSWTLAPPSFAATVTVAAVVIAAVKGMPTLAPIATPSLAPDGSAGGNEAQYFYSLDPERGVYQFGYDTGSLQHQSFREETRTEDGGVRGSYGYVDAGVLRITEYTADQSGYRCRQTIRYLVEPDRGVFVRAGKTHLPSSSTQLQQDSPFSEEWDSKTGSDEPNKVIRHRFMENNHEKEDIWRKRPHSQIDNPELSKQDWEVLHQKSAQPARVLGKKVAGHYTDFTSVPAVGGTGLVTPWDSAHKSELRDDEIFGAEQQRLHQVLQGDGLRPKIGGTLVWPVTEDGTRVVWQPF